MGTGSDAERTEAESRGRNQRITLEIRRQVSIVVGWGGPAERSRDSESGQAIRILVEHHHQPRMRSAHACVAGM